MDSNVFVLRYYDGSDPCRVALVILAGTKYEAEIKADEWLETEKGVRLEETELEVAEAMELDAMADVYRV